MLNKLKKLIPIKLFKALQPIYHFIMAWFSAFVYKFPSRKLIVIGVTGTAGKTSTVYFLAKMLSSAGYKTGFTSTASFSDGNQEWLNDKKMTMPGRLFIQSTLARMLKNNCRYAIVETTSEGIKQFRHRFINYDLILFTSLYPEHIESHGTFEKYKEAKGRLFAHLKNCSTKYINESRIVVKPKNNLHKLDLSRVLKTIIVNGDDNYASYFLNFWSEVKMAYTLKPEININDFAKNIVSELAVKDFTLLKGLDISSSIDGVSLSIGNKTIKLNMLGEFNAYNALAAYAVGLNQRIDPEKLKTGLESVSGLPGKLELISAGQNFTAIVDYSFEPQALTKLYEAIALIPHEKIIHLLGSTGGGRDRARRPILGKIAAEKADIVIVTNEDPYDEDPAIIINAVSAGAEEAGKILNVNLFKLLDRREGIKKALELAEEGDLLLFTGKGAEQYICVAGGQQVAWDERIVVKEEIALKLKTDGSGNEAGEPEA